MTRWITGGRPRSRGPCMTGESARARAVRCGVSELASERRVSGVPAVSTSHDVVRVVHVSLFCKYEISRFGDSVRSDDSM